MKIKIIGLIGLAISLSACSTVVNGSNQLVTFNTGDVDGAKCTVTGGSDNSVNERFVSPAEVKIPRSKKKLNVACSKSGYEDATQAVNSKIEGTTADNILLGGVVGIGVDALTGAIYKYPDVVSIMMNAMGGASDEAVSE